MLPPVNSTPQISTYYYASSPELASSLEAYLIKALGLYYKPVRIFNRHGDATKMRGMRRARIYVIGEDITPEIEKEIKERAGKIDVISLSEKEIMENS
jgi:hypothetical protein